MPRGLDTYYGRQVTGIDTDSDGHWFIELDGGVRIINLDGKRKSPADLPNNGVGLRFANLILESGKTQMAFRDNFDGEWRVAFSPLSYTIFDAEQGTAPFAPQAGGYGKPIEIPVEPTERLADGPDEPTAEEEAMGDHVDAPDANEA